MSVPAGPNLHLHPPESNAAPPPTPRPRISLMRGSVSQPWTITLPELTSQWTRANILYPESTYHIAQHKRPGGERSPLTHGFAKPNLALFPGFALRLPRFSTSGLSPTGPVCRTGPLLLYLPPWHRGQPNVPGSSFQYSPVRFPPLTTSSPVLQ